jgi:hypothetical protein
MALNREDLLAALRSPPGALIIQDAGGRALPFRPALRFQSGAFVEPDAIVIPLPLGGGGGAGPTGADGAAGIQGATGATGAAKAARS